MIYRVLRGLLRVSLAGFFRRIEVQGRELIPRDGPVLLVANHTNAFVDPLLVLTSLDRRVTLTAKATLVRNPLLRFLTRAFDVVLFHRASDVPASAAGSGPGSPEGRAPRGAPGTPASENAAALAECVARLQRGGAVLVFPEGVSHSDPSMRTFKTGAARIVADYLASDAGLDLAIVPVGFHFEEKSRWRSAAVALVGPPVGARAWTAAQDSSGAGGVASVDVVALTEAMRRWIEDLTVNFSSEEERALLSRAERLLEYHPDGPRPLDRGEGMDARFRVGRVHRLQRGTHLLRVRDGVRFRSLATEAESITERLEELGVGAAEVALPMHPARVALFIVREVEILLIGAPLAFAGWIAHAVPLTITRRLVAKMSTDDDHPASNAVFLSLPVFLIWWVVLVGALFLLLPWGWAALVAVVVPYTGAVHLFYRDRTGGAWQRVRTFLLWQWRPSLRKMLEARIVQWLERVREVQAEILVDPETK